MLLVSFISALILLESRELFHGLLSQPFIISFILILFDYDPKFVLVTATVIHLLYINTSPSGTSLFPEYPFGFFLVVSLAGSYFTSGTRILISIVLIILISRLTALFIKFKRMLFEKHKNRILYYHDLPDLRIAVFFSFMISFVYSLAAAGLIKTVFFLIDRYAAPSFIMIIPDKIPIILCIVLALFYAYQSFRQVKR